MEADAIHELTAAYALDALDEHDEREYEEHLARCPSCREELASLTEAATSLAYGVESPSPPAGLRDRILQQARVAQQIDSAAGFRRQPDLGNAIDGAAARFHTREVDLVAHDHPRQGRTKPGDDRGVSGMLGGARVGDNQSQIGALDFRPRSRDADLLDGVVRLAQARGIDDVQRNAIDLDTALFRQRRSRSHDPPRRAD